MRNKALALKGLAPFLLPEQMPERGWRWLARRGNSYKDRAFDALLVDFVWRDRAILGSVSSGKIAGEADFDNQTQPRASEATVFVGSWVASAHGLEGHALSP